MNAVTVFAIGLVALLATGQLVVKTASRLGQRLGLGPTVIGMTIVAVGTSAPELAVVGQSLARDDTELAVGSLIGSNIANILLVLGAAAALGAITVGSRVVLIDVPVMIVASVVLLLFAADGTVARWESLALLAGAVAFTTWTIRAARNGRSDEPSVADQQGNQAAPPVAVATGQTTAGGPPIVASIAGLLVGIGGLAVAARFVVKGAEELATVLGLPELIVGLTVVALGTSAPEIATTLIAVAQGRRELAVGNAVGSNIFNILFVLGAPGLLWAGGIDVSQSAVRLDMPVMVAAAVACLPVLAWDHRLNRWEGVLFMTYYAAYVLFLVLDSSGHDASLFGLVMGAFVVPLTVVTLATVIIRQRRRKLGPAPEQELRATTPPSPKGTKQWVR